MTHPNTLPVWPDPNALNYPQRITDEVSAISLDLIALRLTVESGGNGISLGVIQQIAHNPDDRILGRALGRAL